MNKSNMADEQCEPPSACQCRKLFENIKDRQSHNVVRRLGLIGNVLTLEDLFE